MPALTPTIISNGSTLGPAYQVIGIDISKQVNRIASAEIIMIDGNLALQTFPLSEGTAFDLGNEIEIKLRYEGDEDTTVFIGLVVKHSIEANTQGSLLTIELKDAAIKSTLSRKSVIHKDQTDAEIISALIEQHGLTVGSIESTSATHAEIVQYNCSDWDFLVMRAESQGLLVTVDDSTVSTYPISLEGTASHQFEYGLSEIYSFEVQADALNNFQNTKTQSWDIANQELVDVEASAELTLQQGNFNTQQLAEAFGSENRNLHSFNPLATEEMQAWVDGQTIRSRLARFQGRITVSGFADIKPLHTIELAGMGERFNGTTLVTGIRHRISAEEGWLTDLQLGLSDELFNKKTDISAPEAAGLLPEISGLTIAVVAEFEEDESGEFRIKILLPSVGESADSLWARVATPDAGSGRGFFFRPEPGDEVVVGFFNNDPRQAVVLGSLYSSAQTPFDDWSELSEDNFMKGFVTRTGSKIEFTDEEKSKIRIETAESNSILIDDDAESIEINDQHGNSIVMNADGITLTSAADFNIEASGDVTIAGSKVDIK